MRFDVTTVARSVDGTDFSDLTTAVRTGPSAWADDGGLEIPFDRDLTDTEVAAITNRVLTADSAKEEIRWVLVQYLAKPTKTVADDQAAMSAVAEAVLVYILDL